MGDSDDYFSDGEFDELSDLSDGSLEEFPEEGIAFRDQPDEAAIIPALAVLSLDEVPYDRGQYNVPSKTPSKLVSVRLSGLHEKQK